MNTQRGNESISIHNTYQKEFLYKTAMTLEGDFVGTFTCKARNVAGVGEGCTVVVNNPVAALAGTDGVKGQSNGKVQSDYTFVAFGGSAVFGILFVFALLSILICRKRYGFVGTSKYNIGNKDVTCREGNGRSMEEIENHEDTRATSALIDPSVSGNGGRCSQRGNVSVGGGGQHSIHGNEIQHGK